jgi:hypothetical protein
LRVATEGEEPALQLRARLHDSLGAGEQCAKRFQPASSGVSLASPLNHPKVEQLQPLCRLERPLEPPHVHDLGEIEQGPSDARNRYALSF